MDKLQFLILIRLLAVCWPGTQSERDNHVLACNFSKYSPILKICPLADSPIRINNKRGIKTSKQARHWKLVVTHAQNYLLVRSAISRVFMSSWFRSKACKLCNVINNWLLDSDRDKPVCMSLLNLINEKNKTCLLYTSPSPRD